LNITSYTQLSSTAQNSIDVIWSTELNQNFCLAVYLVRQLSSVDLLNVLKQSGMRHSDYTRALIKEKFLQSQDSEISATSLRICLLCPLSKTRMTIPCRPVSCRHLQCFDASSFLQMNEKKPSWICPVCDKPADYKSLVLDGLFAEILSNSAESNDIEFSADGSWKPLRQKESKPAKSIDESLVIETVPDSPVGSTTMTAALADVQGSSKVVECIDLTETDSDDDDAGGRCVSASSTSSSVVLSSTSHVPQSSGTSSHVSSSSYLLDFVLSRLGPQSSTRDNPDNNGLSKLDFFTRDPVRCLSQASTDSSSSTIPLDSTQPEVISVDDD
jgi:E3 SUMO-protein ligase PIAS1